MDFIEGSFRLFAPEWPKCSMTPSPIHAGLPPMLLSEKVMLPGQTIIARQIWRLFATTSCLLLELGLAPYWSMHQVVRNRDASSRTSAIESSLQMLLGDLLDAETGQRGSSWLWTPPTSNPTSPPK